jgi:hypothetical protein
VPKNLHGDIAEGFAAGSRLTTACRATGNDEEMQVTEQRGAMPVFVISLCDAAERRKRALEQLDAAGIEFRFFDAVTPREVRESGEFRYIDEEAFLVNTGRHCVPAEIACFASHRRLWQHCVDLDMPIAILEDDSSGRCHCRCCGPSTTVRVALP